MSETTLTDVQVAHLCAVAEILLPGTGQSPTPSSLPELAELVQRAARTLGRDRTALEDAIGALPTDLTWDTLSTYADARAEGFELIALVVVGAYFMSPTVLSAIGLPTGDRRPPPLDQAVDELSSGILDAVFERGCPVKTVEDIRGAG